jgi:hypothetical protein
MVVNCVVNIRGAATPLLIINRSHTPSVRPNRLSVSTNCTIEMASWVSYTRIGVTVFTCGYERLLGKVTSLFPQNMHPIYSPACTTALVKETCRSRDAPVDSASHMKNKLVHQLTGTLFNLFIE